MNSLIDKILFLEKVDIFRDVSLEELGQIADITEVEDYTQDEILFKQGDPGNDACIVVSGQVRTYYETGEKDPSSGWTFEAGSSFGEMSLLDGQPRSATARMITDGRIARIGRESFLRLMRRYPTIALAILSQLSERLRDTNTRMNKLVSACRDFSSVYETIAPLIGGTE